MTPPRSIAASLTGPHITSFAPRIEITPDRHGDLPALLVDPIDNRGRRIEGLWMLDGAGNPTSSAVYRWVETRHR
ncbi:hypothetical protein GCM10022381_12590 [Leifsonia kafniensis]|uniref:Uncharacterized protein n=1 Tax=Leifsonia kafniensis TaxID=475957 RepID=A0ABP7KAE1_9MICO